MCPCTPDQVSISPPSSANGPGIPGFGIPFSLPIPNINPFPDGFPEDLLDLFNKLKIFMPGGNTIRPQLPANIGKDLLDALFKMLDQFLPLLASYKLILPILKIIICLINVLCAIPNPIKLAKALEVLFTDCIPTFLSLFPIFALILMILSILILILEFIIYLIEQLLKLIEAILRNINALNKAFQNNAANGVLAIALKLGSLLCIFQNFFVLLAIFAVIIEVIKDILSLVFSIPPCSDGSGGCCDTSVCPSIVQNTYTNTTGTLQYLNEVGYQTSVILPTGNLTVDLRSESWQLYDTQQTIPQEFINIVDGYDVTVSPRPIFFPTDSNYSATTPASQAAYTIDLQLFYNPVPWGRTGIPRNIVFKDCIVLAAPTRNLKTYSNGTSSINNGVLEIAGGKGYEADGTTQLNGFASDGVSPVSDQATLNNFLHKPAEFATNPILSPTDGYVFSNAQYTFKPNFNVLLQKNLVVLGCEPNVSFNRTFVNNVIFGDVNLKLASLNNLVNGVNGAVFPDPNAALACLQTAVSGLRGNLTTAGVATFQTTVMTCLNKLQDDTTSAIGSIIGIGFDASKSTLAIDPAIQFTTLPIEVTVNLNESSGTNLALNIPTSVADDLANRITPYITFGSITNFAYDGYQSFTAQITSPIAGSGQIQVAFDNNMLSTNILPTDGSAPSHTIQTLDYQFIQTNFGAGSKFPLAPTGDDDTDGKPRYDDGDLGGD